jgi:hypothetical protein
MYIFSVCIPFADNVSPGGISRIIWHVSLVLRELTVMCLVKLHVSHVSLAAIATRLRAQPAHNALVVRFGMAQWTIPIHLSILQCVLSAHPVRFHSAKGWWQKLAASVMLLGSRIHLAPPSV